MRVVCAVLCLGLVGALQREQVAQHAIKLHRGRSAVAKHAWSWVSDNCRRLGSLIRQKNTAIKKLAVAAAAVGRDHSLSDPERLFQVGQSRMDRSRTTINRFINNNKHIGHIEDNNKQVHQQQQHIGHIEDNNKQMNGVHVANVEAVLRVEEEEEDGGKRRRNASRRGGEVEDDVGLSMLIDSQNNQYVLTKPRDSTMPRSDQHFIKDLVSVVMLSLPCGWLCTMMGLPPMFGYIVCGVLLGPSGLNSIKSMVQVETLGELGVFFTLFVVGLEFSPERLRKVWKTSMQGSCYLSLLMVATGLLWGQVLHIRPTQTVFISSCLSLSSTPLVSRFLAGGTRADKDGELDYSSVLLGMLVMQDVQLGLFIAVMPTLIQVSSGHLDSVLFGGLRVLLLLSQVLFSLAVVLLLCVLLKSFLIGPYYRKVHAESKGNKEILVLGTAAFVFLMLTVCNPPHSSPSPLSSCVFSTTAGFHVFPTFVLYELTVLVVLTLSLVIMKFLMAVLVLSAILPKGSRHIRWIVSAGLAQVSEFSFVLGSRARRAGIISREVYLLVLSVTTLSLLLAPVLWRAATHKWVPRAERKTLARPPPLLPHPAD
uniref:Transmembrane and coiled-coil domains 3 n=1 Tax=Hucho hucho TaxID=62062 RepID=A0A4W5NCP3_9TELE